MQISVTIKYYDQPETDAPTSISVSSVVDYVINVMSVGNVEAVVAVGDNGVQHWFTPIAKGRSLWQQVLRAPIEPNSEVYTLEVITVGEVGPGTRDRVRDDLNERLKLAHFTAKSNGLDRVFNQKEREE